MRTKGVVQIEEERDRYKAENERLSKDVSALVEALERIASWPDGGNQSGQPHIKMFAAKAIAAHKGSEP